MTINDDSQNNNQPSPWFVRSGRFLQGVFISIYRTTIQSVKNVPSKLINHYRVKTNERKRLPKRKSPNRIYVLVGYTTRAQIDRKIRKEKYAHTIRNILIVGIIALLILLSYRSVIPLIDSELYKQMIGIDDVEDMTKNDPFENEYDHKVVIFSTDPVADSSIEPQ